MQRDITAISGPPFTVPLYTRLSGDDPIMLLKSSHATSSSCLLYLFTSFNASESAESCSYFISSIEARIQYIVSITPSVLLNMAMIHMNQLKNLRSA